MLWDSNPVSYNYIASCECTSNYEVSFYLLKDFLKFSLIFDLINMVLNEPTVDWCSDTFPGLFFFYTYISLSLSLSLSLYSLYELCMIAGIWEFEQSLYQDMEV